jgi:hypothetical protein
MAGSKSATNVPMMAMTTSNSTNVKACVVPGLFVFRNMANSTRSKLYRLSNNKSEH